jgi:DNA transformation protein
MSELIEHLRGIFEQLGPVATRRMFGGYGLYHDGVMFGLVADESLYLKADGEAVAHFEARGLGPFTYRHRGREVAMSYYLAPPEVLEDPQEAAVWGRRAYEAALRARAAQSD